MHHAFLDLIPADGGAAHRLSDLAGQGGLARSRRATDEYERGMVNHFSALTMVARRSPVQPGGVARSASRSSPEPDRRDNTRSPRTSSTVCRDVSQRRWRGGSG